MKTSPQPRTAAASTASLPASRVVSAGAALLLAAVLILYLGTTGALPLLGKDEPRYVEIARAMWQRGDWITPTLGGSTWFEKPVLLYWLAMAGFAAFGVSEWAARLGPALCGLGTVGLVFWMARRVETKAAAGTQAEAAAQAEAGMQAAATAPEVNSEVNRARGSARGVAWWSALATASSIGLIMFAHVATFDIVLTAAITLALACFFVSELETAPPKRRWLLAGLWAGVGLSLMAKGLVGLILPGGVVMFYFVLRRDWRGLGRLQMGWGLLLALAVAGLWYGPVIARHGQPFINEFFVQHHFARYFSDKYRHSQPAYYYLPVIALFAFPWTAFLLSALLETPTFVRRANAAMRDANSDAAMRDAGRVVRSGAARDAGSNANGDAVRIALSAGTEDNLRVEDSLRVFALAWLVVPVAFFSLSGSKLAGYVLPALPGAMLLAGGGVADYVRGASGLGRARLSGVMLMLLGAGLVIYAARSHMLPLPAAVATALPLLLAGGCALALAERRSLCAGLLAGAVLLSASLLTGAGASLGERDSVRSLMRQAAQRGYAQTPVWQMHTMQRTAEFYAAGRLLYDAEGEPKKFDDAAAVVQALPGQGAVLVLAPLDREQSLRQESRLQSERIGDNGEVVLLRVQRRAAGGASQ